MVKQQTNAASIGGTVVRECGYLAFIMPLGLSPHVPLIASGIASLVWMKSIEIAPDYDAYIAVGDYVGGDAFTTVPGYCSLSFSLLSNFFSTMAIGWKAW